METDCTSLMSVTGLTKIHDTIVPSRAVQTLPSQLQYRRGTVTPRTRALAPRTRFGPVQGIMNVMTESIEALVWQYCKQNKPVFLLTKVDGTVVHIDMCDLDKTNWTALLPVGDSSTANVWLHEENNELYGVTLQSINTRTALKLGYSKQYADRYGIASTQPILDIFSELSKWPKEWWCEECARALPSKSTLANHTRKLHKDTKTQARYRCVFCAHMFKSIFALRRHKKLFCERSGMDNEDQQQSAEQNVVASQNGVDDSTRLPSDESLQNYTNLLDISTNLFDPDRISSLDVSVSGKSDNEFNIFGLKDDCRLASDFDFANGLINALDTSTNVVTSVETPDLNEVKKLKGMKSSSPFTCTYCKLDMPKKKLKRHTKVCPKRKFDCACGKRFRNKEKLSEHILAAHPITTSADRQNKNVGNNPTKPDETTYKCDECTSTFKRRGMLVNHMSKVHKKAANVPLVVTVKRYPCPACANIYMTANKRDSHVKNHHPAIQYDRSLCVVTASRATAGAPCALCPRQYGSRAKLLQHQRRAHPAID